MAVFTTVRTVAMVMTAVVMLEPGSAFVPLQQPCATAVSFFSPGTRLPWTCLRSALRVERRRVLSRGRGSARWRPPTALVSWSDLEDTTPRILPSVFSEAELSEPIAAGKTVLYRDANGWCPYAERVWLALELKNADYVTCLVDNEDAAEPGSVGSLPRVRWADGTSDDGSNILSILERIEREYPQAPALFPDMSASVDYVRDSFERFDGIMPRFTKPSRAAPYVLACKIQRAGSFEIENCELGELVPKFKYDVCLEEIEEMLEEYDDGPFFAGKSISAADVYWAPFLERLAAQLPVLYPTLSPRRPGSRFEALSEWYNAMDEKVPCYASRVKGRAEVWQARMADEPWLEDKVVGSSAVAVPDLPPRRGFNGDAVWARYANDRPHLASTPAQEAAATIVRNRRTLVQSLSTAQNMCEDVDGALREVCSALLRNAEAGPAQMSEDGQRVAAYLDSGPKGFAVPRDLGVLPAEALRSLVRGR